MVLENKDNNGGYDGVSGAVYSTFIGFEYCQSPCMLHIETANMTPGLLVFMLAVTLWWV